MALGKTLAAALVTTRGRNARSQPEIVTSAMACWASWHWRSFALRADHGRYLHFPPFLPLQSCRNLCLVRSLHSNGLSQNSCRLYPPFLFPLLHHQRTSRRMKRRILTSPFMLSLAQVPARTVDCLSCHAPTVGCLVAAYFQRQSLSPPPFLFPCLHCQN